ncbi:hypothetical protein POM88_047263 [Heracleum sosnowskyi]|uniref:Uncharacterized protein n=1 Tax=Heracleum sosnowskyi TaxID=360622 RepID=A0AAD8GRU0_9APIA|nr:hypothetical protein POM88_047263 [Heracleum sosnowskyi]
MPWGFLVPAYLMMMSHNWKQLQLGQKCFVGDSLKIAEPLDGPIMKVYCSLARESDDSHLRNTPVSIDNAGNIKSTYCKMHLYALYLQSLSPMFDVDVPGGAVNKESRFTEADHSSSTSRKA